MGGGKDVRVFFDCDFDYCFDFFFVLLPGFLLADPGLLPHRVLFSTVSLLRFDSCFSVFLSTNKNGAQKHVYAHTLSQGFVVIYDYYGFMFFTKQPVRDLF